MTMALALAVVAMSASTIAQDAPQTRVAIICTSSGEQLGGRTKICYYNCAKSEGAMTKAAYETCPAWEPSWRLNRNSQFGPRRKSR